MSSWTDVGKSIAPFAPALGGILGGFLPIPFGSSLGKMAGNIVAGVLGVAPTPEAVSDKLAQMTHDEKMEVMRQATERARIQSEEFREVEKQYYETIRVGITQTGMTMREEIKVENRHWFFTGWRPAAGWVFVLYAIIFGAILMYAIWADPIMLARINDAWKVIAAFFATLAAMVGVYVVARSMDKAAGADTSTVKAPVPPAPAPKPVPKPPLPVREPRT